jgi:DHA1 family tetracycline resistance protein-like MFS transporter
VGAKARNQVILLGSLVFMAMFNLTLVSPGLKVYIEAKFDFSDSDIYIGVFASAEMFAYIIFAPIWGYLSDKHGKRAHYVVMGLAISSVLFVIMPMVPNYWVLVGLRFVQGAFTVAAWSLAMTMALDWAGATDRGRTMGVLGAGMMMGMALGAPLGGQVTDRWVEGPFFIASAVFGVALLLAWLVLEEPLERRKKHVGERPPLSEERDLWIPSAYGFVERFTAGFFITSFSPFLINEFDFSVGQAGMYLGIFFLPFALLQYPFGRLTDRYGPLPFILGGSVMYGVIMIAVTYFQPVPIAILMMLLGVLAASMLPASLILVGHLSVPSTYGRAMGLFNALGSVGFAAGLLLSGVLSGLWSYSASFTVGGISVIVVVAVTAFPLVRMFKDWRPPSTSE